MPGQFMPGQLGFLGAADCGPLERAFADKRALLADYNYDYYNADTGKMSPGAREAYDAAYVAGEAYHACSRAAAAPLPVETERPVTQTQVVAHSGSYKRGVPGPIALTPHTVPIVPERSLTESLTSLFGAAAPMLPSALALTQRKKQSYLPQPMPAPQDNTFMLVAIGTAALLVVVAAVALRKPKV
jgi:hypothetical protein